jgi:phosphoribosylformylglycinamidine (FGAM) synthase-like enzyme
VSLPGDAFTFLFSESAARLVVAVLPGAEAGFADLCERHAVPAQALGTVGGTSLEVVGSFAVPLDELAAVRQGVLPALFG